MLNKRSRPCEFGEINDSLSTARNLYPSGPQLSEKARLIAEHLGVSNHPIKPKTKQQLVREFWSTVDVHKCRQYNQSSRKKVKLPANYFYANFLIMHNS